MNPLWSNQEEINKQRDTPPHHHHPDHQTHTQRQETPAESCAASGKTRIRTAPCDCTTPESKEPPPLPKTGNWGLLQVPVIQGERQGPPILTHPACPADSATGSRWVKKNQEIVGWEARQAPGRAESAAGVEAPGEREALGSLRAHRRWGLTLQI